MRFLGAWSIYLLPVRTRNLSYNGQSGQMSVALVGSKRWLIVQGESERGNVLDGIEWYFTATGRTVAVMTCASSSISELATTSPVGSAVFGRQTMVSVLETDSEAPAPFEKVIRGVGLCLKEASSLIFYID